jgi:N-acetylglucosamine kinase-like BadF-type ATPase
MRLFLGVDGGQSSTTALIGDETGRVIGAGVGGPCNHAAAEEGRRKLERAVRESVTAACQQAGLDTAPRFEAACFGMSGGPEDKRAILAAIIDTAALVVMTDAEVALAGATDTGLGVIVIAGTGSIALGRNASRTLARSGGWGYIFGDEGSAFDIVRQALRAALRMEEGWGPPTRLRQVLLDATKSRDANEMLHRFYTPDWPRDRVATLAPLVDTASTEGDSAAIDILNYCAQQLAMLASSVRAQLWQAPETVEVAFIGGVFTSAIVRERFRMLVELDAGTKCGPPKHTPAAGALLEAYRAVGMPMKAMKLIPLG